MRLVAPPYLEVQDGHVGEEGHRYRLGEAHPTQVPPRALEEHAMGVRPLLRGGGHRSDLGVAKGSVKCEVMCDV